MTSQTQTHQERGGVNITRLQPAARNKTHLRFLHFIIFIIFIAVISEVVTVTRVTKLDKTELDCSSF